MATVDASIVWTPLGDVRCDAIAFDMRKNGNDAPLAREEANKAIMRGLSGATISARGTDYQLEIVTNEGNTDYPPLVGPDGTVPTIFWHLWVEATTGGQGSGDIDWARGWLCFRLPAGGGGFFDGRIRDLQLTGTGLAAITGAMAPAAQRFTDTERNEWMGEQQQMTADAAYKLFKQHARYDGIKQDQFRTEWKSARGTKVGRPPRNS